MTERSKLWERALMLWAATPAIAAGLAVLIPVMVCVICACLFVYLYVLGGTVAPTP